MKYIMLALILWPTLHLQGHTLKDISPEKPLVLYPTNARGYYALNLSDQGLSDISGIHERIAFCLEANETYALKDFPYLICLNINNNKLTAISEDIKEIQNIVSLDASSNKFEEFPEIVTELNKLQALDLFSNEIVNVPDSIGNLRNLKTLNLSSNEIQTIPHSLLNLTVLKQLYLNDNALISLPHISQLQKLESVDLSVQDNDEKAKKTLRIIAQAYITTHKNGECFYDLESADE